jgi:hypothetical protein
MTSASAREWEPHAGPQTEFLACPAFEVGYGGAAGGGKSDALLVGALRHVHIPQYRAVLFRRTYPELQGSLIERSMAYYPVLGGTYNEAKKTWTFPSGAKVVFSHMQHESDVTAHLSMEYQYIAFDEASTFTEKQYKFLISRCRSSTGIPTRVRWGSNPPDDSEHWLIKRFGPWIDTRATYVGPRARDGEILHVTVDDEGQERYVPKGTRDAFSRAFFQARLTDNPTLMRNDPGYALRIRQMGQEAIQQFLHGNWFVSRVEGALWTKEDFDATRAIKPPEDLVQIVVAVDPAVTDTAASDEHGIMVGGRCMSGHVWVWEDNSLRGSPEKWGRAAIDSYRRHTANVIVGEVNNGGDLVKANIANLDPSVPFQEVRASRGKAKRAEPVVTLMRRGMVHIVGALPQLESECKRWVPGVSTWSPNRMDAFVWLVNYLVPEGAWDNTPPPPKPVEQAIDERMEQQIRRGQSEDPWGMWG